MRRWEYCILSAVESAKGRQYTIAYGDRAEQVQADNRIEVMQTLGDEGWELVGVNPLAAGINEFYFKRESR